MKQTTLCYIEHDNQYLMLHRTKKANDYNHDKWIGIGGHIEPGETPQDCVLREVWEETGLTLTDCEYRGIVRFRSDGYEDEDMHLFTATRYTGEIIDCDEGDLAWIDKGDLLRLTLWEGDKVFVKLLDTRRDFFDLTLNYHGEALVGAVLDGEPLEI
ncbi:MAG: 8-oxo-dGTP diphosphatase [Clostridia bacterium]|nr:8-oxo-dGTP diphosphatase [Clostridia bacterium]